MENRADMTGDRREAASKRAGCAVAPGIGMTFVRPRHEDHRVSG